VCDLANRLILFVACGEGNRERERDRQIERQRVVKRREGIRFHRSDPIRWLGTRERNVGRPRPGRRHATPRARAPSHRRPVPVAHRSVSAASPPPHQTYNSRPARGIPCHVASMLISSVPRRTSPGRPIHEGISFACGTNSVGG
jgi:hypothetical protein